jgi:hypothetical protein
MEKGRGLFVKLEFPWINRIIFVLNNRWTRSTACGPCPAMVHGGPAVDGGTELTGAWPPVASVSKGTAQGAGEGGVERRETDGPLTGAWEVVRRPSDGGEGGGGQNFSAEHARAQRVGNEG